RPALGPAAGDDVRRDVGRGERRGPRGDALERRHALVFYDPIDSSVNAREGEPVATLVPGLTGFCAALLPPEAGGPDPRALAGRVQEYLDRLPGYGRVGLGAGYAAMEALAVVTTRHRLSALDVDAREAVLARAAAHPQTYDLVQ